MVHSQERCLKLNFSILWARRLGPSLLALSGVAADGGTSKLSLLVLAILV
jgi:hypothetical protein